MTDQPYELVLTPPRHPGEATQSVAAAVVEFMTTVLLDNPRRVGTQLAWRPGRHLSALRGTYRVLYRINDAASEVESSGSSTAATCIGPAEAGDLRLPDHPMIADTLRDGASTLTPPVDVQSLCEILCMLPAIRQETFHMGWDPESPYNDLPPLPPPGVELEPRAVLTVAVRARSAVAALDQAALHLHNPWVLLNATSLLEAQASSEIENIVTTADAMFNFAKDEDAGDLATKEALRCRSALLSGVDPSGRAR